MASAVVPRPMENRPSLILYPTLFIEMHMGWYAERKDRHVGRRGFAVRAPRCLPFFTGVALMSHGI